MSDPTHPRRWLVLPVLCLSVFLVVVDNTIVNVALPTLSAELDATIARRVASLLGCGPRAQREIKRLLRDLVGRPIDAALLADTADRIAAARASDEGREGLQAMLDKRAPPWAPGAGAVVDAGGGAPPSGDQDRDRGQP